jgi:1-acyl-sn-glycerol-3-phosphate acyltransferase
MAVSNERPEDGEDAPGRGTHFVIDVKVSVIYRVLRVIMRALVRLWFRPAVIGRTNVPAEGPVVLAPIHRSFADFSIIFLMTDRKVFFMAKDELWRSRALAWFLPTVGVFPVHRASADREALLRAEQVLARGQLLVMFPEGARQEGAEVRPLHDGAAFLAGRAGAVLVPVGIGGSDRAMPKGSRLPHRTRVQVVIGPGLEPPGRSEGGRLSRRAVRQVTEELRTAMQAVYDLARS